MKALMPIMLCSVTAWCQPPAGKIVYSSVKSTDSIELYVINSDGTGDKQLTSGKLWCDLPDVHGSAVIYRQRAGNEQSCDIVLTHLGSNSRRQLIQDDIVCYPRWRPDGKFIAYEYYTSGSQDIWLMDSTGGSNSLLIRDARHPSWTRNGKRIVFTRGFDIYMFDLKSQKETRLTYAADKGMLAKWPAISPDEGKLAYVGFYNNDKRGIFIIDLENDGAAVIAENCLMPCWTDDPGYLVCSYNPGAGKGSQIVMLNVATGEKIPVTKNTRDNDFPCWVSAAE